MTQYERTEDEPLRDIIDWLVVTLMSGEAEEILDFLSRAWF